MLYRTDLAMESACLQTKPLPPGIQQSSRSFENLNIHRVSITSRDGAQAAGKPEGEYVTVTVPSFSHAQEVSEEETGEIAGEIRAMLPEKGLVLVVGLGNADITPDAVGPCTIHGILATRHIQGEFARQIGLDGLRAVAALAPGVLGQTGIETSEVIRSVVRQIEPAAVIVVDALAARSASRLGCTIQIANSGISPGSGVMNARKALNQEILGVPVIAAGVPTVVDAQTLVADLMSGERGKQRPLFLPDDQPMMVTPREIDQLISRACKTLAFAINQALQPQLTLEELAYLAE